MRYLLVYVVNNYGQFNHLILRALRDLDMSDLDVELVPNSLSPSEIMEEKPSGLVLGGGPSLEKAGMCVEYVRKLDIPILGICLGHQLIALALGGKVRKGRRGGYASVEVEVIDEDVILKGLGPSLKVWASHQDEVSVLPPNFMKLARSEVCEIEAMAHMHKPIFGVQWHPEVIHTEKGEQLFRNFIAVCMKK
ncbi:GMP synthase subunit A [Methanosarcinales archaeon]|nr:MAG: GMP synthase subunit A [Methanosarcinales archaeon]